MRGVPGKSIYKEKKKGVPASVENAFFVPENAS